MKNWKTTLSGIIGALGVAAIGYVQAYPAQFAKYPWVQPVAAILAASGVLGTGGFAKDNSTHSTAAEVQFSTVEKQQETQPAGTTMTSVDQTVTQSTKP